MGSADDSCLRGYGSHVVPGARVAIAGKIGFQEIAVGLGLALKRAELELGLALPRGLRLQVAEVVAQRGLPGARHRRLVLEALDDLGRLVADLRPDVGKLRGELLDARVGRHERRRQLCQLALDLHALINKPADQLGFQHRGRGVDIAVVGEHLLDQSGACLGLGLLRVGENHLAVELRELLRVEGDVVAASEEALA